MAQCVLHKMAFEGSFASEKLESVLHISDLYSYAPIKAALNFGFLVRRDYLIFLEKHSGSILDIRNEEIDESYINQCEILHMNAFLYLPLRKNERGELLVAAADPYDEKLVTSLVIKFKCKIILVAAPDLDITWLAHKLRGGFFVKEAVFSLMKKHPESSALITFTDAQLFFIFGSLGLTIALVILFFKPTFIVLNLLSSLFFLFSGLSARTHR
jgi:hypothetical protein